MIGRVTVYICNSWKYLEEGEGGFETGDTVSPSTGYVSVNSNWVHPPGNPRGLAQKTCPGGSGFDF